MLIKQILPLIFFMNLKTNIDTSLFSIVALGESNYQVLPIWWLWCHKQFLISKSIKQAGAKLCQAKVKLKVIVYFVEELKL